MPYAHREKLPGRGRPRRISRASRKHRRGNGLGRGLRGACSSIPPARYLHRAFLELHESAMKCNRPAQKGGQNIFIEIEKSPPKSAKTLDHHIEGSVHTRKSHRQEGPAAMRVARGRALVSASVGGVGRRNLARGRCPSHQGSAVGGVCRWLLPISGRGRPPAS
jgi:hypothetical protein